MIDVLGLLGIKLFQHLSAEQLEILLQALNEVFGLGVVCDEVHVRQRVLRVIACRQFGLVGPTQAPYGADEERIEL